MRDFSNMTFALLNVLCFVYIKRYSNINPVSLGSKNQEIVKRSSMSLGFPRRHYKLTTALTNDSSQTAFMTLRTILYPLHRPSHSTGRYEACSPLSLSINSACCSPVAVESGTKLWCLTRPLISRVMLVTWYSVTRALWRGTVVIGGWC